MTAATAAAPSSLATARAKAFVAARKSEATILGRAAGEHVHDPDTLVDTLNAGLPALADPEYLEGMQLVAPGIGPVLGIRQPLLRAIGSGLRAAFRGVPSSTRLDIAARLVREPLIELHWLAYGILERTIRDEPERTWQLVRAESRAAHDWATVDALAHVAALGIVAEPYRWAELEQLVYSPSRWERRLAGSTIATLPFADRVAGRHPEIAVRGLRILADLMGDASPDVQKSLSWAIRSLTIVDLPATVAFLRAEARTARATDDGARAWVVRDSLEKVPAPVAAELRAAVDGIRRRPNAASTSRAAETAVAFAGLGVAVPPAERPIVDRSSALPDRRSTTS
jgi:3-methyladenine DNA glycosylase AlkD